MTACKTVENDPDETYKKDLSIQWEDYRFSGFSSLPKRKSYSLEIRSRKDPELVRISSCHRDVVLRDVKDKFRYEYTPSHGIEDVGSCIVQIATFDEKGFHQFGAIDFADDETMPAEIFCNGENYKAGGVSTCQAKVGTIQLIVFAKPVEVLPLENCPTPESADDKSFEYTIAENFCLYLFSEKIGDKFHRLTTFGYNEVMKR